MKVATVGRKPSFAVLPGLRQVAKARLLDTIARLSPADLARVAQAAAEYLSD